MEPNTYNIIVVMCMSIEQREARIMINKAGGNASTTAVNYRIALPSSWMNELGISNEDRDVTLQFDGESITIRKKSPSEYSAFLASAREAGHDILVLHYYCGDVLCTKICADKVIKQVVIENLTDDIFLTAFGVTGHPDWSDFDDFITSRCVPSQRDGLKYYLESIGLDRYDPLEIIRKTGGRMAEDEFRIEILEG